MSCILGVYMISKTYIIEHYFYTTSLLALVSYFLLIYGCANHSSSESHQTIQVEDSTHFPIIIDTYGFLHTKSSNSSYNWMKTASYHPLYFGLLDDSIEVNYYVSPFFEPPTNIYSQEPVNLDLVNQYYDSMSSTMLYSSYFTRHELEFLGLETYDSVELQILIDTTQTIVNLFTNKESIQFYDSTIIFPAFPVLILNNSPEPIAVGYGRHIPLIMEAKNSQGEWKPIEGKYYYQCGMGLPLILLPSQEVILTSAPIFSGPFETDLRLKLGNSYSQTFQVSINQNQFISKYGY